MTKRKEENLLALTKSLERKEGKRQSPEKRDFREFKVLYLCTAIGDEQELCLGFSPAGDNSCNRKNHLTGFCNWEG